MSALAAAGAAAGSSLLDFAGSSIMANSANAKSKRQALASFMMQNYFMDKQNAYNKPINQMKRLREAGLNPNLVYDNGNAIISSAGPSGGAMADVTPASGTFNVLGKMEVLNAMKQQEASIKETEARTKAIDDNIKLKGQELEERKRYNTERLRLLQSQIDRYGYQNAKSQAEIDYLNNKAPSVSDPVGYASYYGNKIYNWFKNTNLYKELSRARDEYYRELRERYK